MKKYAPWALPIAVLLLLAGSAFTGSEPAHREIVDNMGAGALFLVLVLVAYVGKNTIPSVLSLVVLGWAAQDYQPFLWLHQNPSVSNLIITMAVALVIFEEGLGTHLGEYRRYAFPIIVLALPGCLLTAYFFALLAHSVLGMAATVAVAFGLIGAATDPASVIALMRGKSLKDSTRVILTGESVGNDIAVAVMSTILKGMLLTGAVAGSVSGIFGDLLGPRGLLQLFWQITAGCTIGLLGFLVLDVLFGKDDSNLTPLYRTIERSREIVSEVRACLENGGGVPKILLILFVCLSLFYATDKIGGSGLLAVFVAGLVFRAYEHEGEAEISFKNWMLVLMVPLLFFCLGLRIDTGSMLDSIGLGLGATILMVIARFGAVIVTICPLNWWYEHVAGAPAVRLTAWDILFSVLAAPRGAVSGMGFAIFLTAGILDEHAFSAAIWVVIFLLVITVAAVKIAPRLPGVLESEEAEVGGHTATHQIA